MFASDFNIRSSVLPHFMDPRGRVAQNAYFSLLTHIKQLLLMILSDLAVGIGAGFWTHGMTE